MPRPGDSGPGPVQEIQAVLESLRNDPVLRGAAGFADRAEALDRIEFGILDQIEGLLKSGSGLGRLVSLRRTAEALKRELEDIDEDLFRTLRTRIRAGECRGAEFLALIREHVGTEFLQGRLEAGHGYDPRFGYDPLDAFLNGLLFTREPPMEARPREPDMVYYQKTPARIVLELVEKAAMTGSDVFYDVGSGLGQVCQLAAILSEARIKGIEYDPALCGYAQDCAADLGLHQVEYLNEDARAADYSVGTVFFLFTPFEGRMMEEVLDRLHVDTRERSVRIFTFGPCIGQVSARTWLERLDNGGNDPGRLAVFRSRV